MPFQFSTNDIGGFLGGLLGNVIMLELRAHLTDETSDPAERRQIASDAVDRVLARFGSSQAGVDLKTVRDELVEMALEASSDPEGTIPPMLTLVP